MSGENGNTAEQQGSNEASESAAAAAAFASARSDEPIVVTPKAEPEVVDQPEAATSPPIKLIAGKTEEEIATLLSEIPSMRDGYRKQLDNLNGKFGVLNGALQKLQQDTPSGEQVTVTDEDLAEMQAEYPELATLTKSALNNVLKRINLKGASSDPAIIDERVNKLVGERMSSEKVAIHKELLQGLSPDWNKIIGVPDVKTGEIPKTEFRIWLATQPAEYQQKINGSNNAFEINSSIKAFQEAHDAIAKKQAQNKQRLVNAVQPQGSVPAAHGVISEQQAADAAFKKDRGR